MPDGCLVVVPAYNEADTIEEVVRRSLTHADVCVVDDGSKDGTAELVDAVGGAHVIRHTRNTHIAGAIVDGFAYAREQGYSHCITMDAGLSHDPDAIPRFRACEGADLVLGYRAETIDVPLRRRALSLVASGLMNMALNHSVLPWRGAGLRDLTSGYRMYSRAAYEVILDSDLVSKTFDFHLEALARVHRAGLRIDEVPISYRYTNSSLQLGIVADAARTCGRIWTGRLA